MAQKKITDLTLRADFDDSVNLPGDDTSQTWRVTGAQIKTWAKAAIAPITTLGDLVYGGASGVATRLAGNTTTTKKFLAQTGTGSVSAAPSFEDIVATDLPAISNRIRVLTPNGYGSTNTKIRKYSGTPTQLGSGITYTSSATNGDSFTIVTAGLYSVTTVDFKASGAAQMGISVNSNQLTTNISSITDSHRVLYGICGATGGSNLETCFTQVFRFAANDVVRVHSDGTLDGTASRHYIDIIQIGN